MAIRILRSGLSAMLKAVMTTLLCGAVATVGAQTPNVSAEHAVAAPVPTPAAATRPGADSGQVGYHDLICKPNGTEDGFECADEATPAKIVPIPSQGVGPRPQDGPISG